MNKMKYLAAMLIAVAGLGLQHAQADLINPQQFFTPNSIGNPQQERDYLVANGYMDECCQFGAKFGADGEVEGDFAQYFTVTFTGNTATVSWNLPDGFILCGALLKDGNVQTKGELYRFYDVAADQLNNGDGTVTFDDPVRDISHISFFVCADGVGVPDGGTTVMLLGAALGSLGMARRFLKR
jgi:hypothetical protein